MDKHIHQLFVLFLLFLSTTHAAEAQSTAPAKMVKTEDTYLMQFADGREARVFYQLGNRVTGSLSMRQIENTCEPSLPLVRCQMDFNLQPYQLELRWTKNPDNSRVGQIVIFKNGYESPPSEKPVKTDINSLSWYYLYASRAKSSMGFRPDRLSCENFDWMMQSQSLPEKILIQSWGGEAMVPNEETKISENATIGGSKNLLLERVDPKTYQITGIHFSYPGQRPGNFPPFISPQVSNLTFYSPAHKKYCQVSFEMNIGKIVALITSPEYNKVNPDTLTPAQLDFWQYNDFFLPSTIRSLTTRDSKYEAK